MVNSNNPDYMLLNNVLYSDVDYNYSKEEFNSLIDKIRKEYKKKIAELDKSNRDVVYLEKVIQEKENEKQDLIKNIAESITEINKKDRIIHDLINRKLTLKERIKGKIII